MTIFEKLELGNKYGKKQLAEILGEDGLLTVREGVFSCKNTDSYLLFVDLEKEGKEDRFHFNDYFEGGVSCSCWVVTPLENSRQLGQVVSCG